MPDTPHHQKGCYFKAQPLRPRPAVRHRALLLLGVAEVHFGDDVVHVVSVDSAVVVDGVHVAVADGCCCGW